MSAFPTLEQESTVVILSATVLNIQRAMQQALNKCLIVWVMFPEYLL